MTAQTDLVLVHHDGSVATVTINRPDKLNALNVAVLSALHDALSSLRTQDGVRCIILTGAGEKAFVAGADIAEMCELGVDEARKLSEMGQAVLSELEQIGPPVIAAVGGFALGGGCELALACDFIHASEKARFGLPEVKLGVIPGFGGTQRLARRVGIGRARELVYTGRMIGADEAKQIGLVNEVHAPADLLANVREVARMIAAAGPRAVAEAKRAMRDGEGRPLPEANRLEVEGFARCFSTADQREGMAAFLEKREAKFEGR